MYMVYFVLSSEGHISASTRLEAEGEDWGGAFAIENVVTSFVADAIPPVYHLPSKAWMDFWISLVILNGLDEANFNCIFWIISVTEKLYN